MNQEKVEPCPFCGSTHIYVVDGSTYRWCKAQCSECGGSSGEVRRTSYVEINHLDRRAALVEWNKRGAKVTKHDKTNKPERT